MAKRGRRVKAGPIRVLFPYVGDSVGGSHISSLLLASYLALGDDVVPTIGVFQRGPLERYLARQGIGFTRLPPPVGVMHTSLRTGLWNSLASAPTLARWLRRHKIHVVHTHDFRMHVLWGFACRLAGAKHVLHLRSPIKRSRSFTLLAAISNRVVTVSKFVRDLLGNRMGGKTLVLGNPIETPVDTSHVEANWLGLVERFPRLSDSLIVAWSGNFHERKRPGDFVKAVALLPPEDCQNVSFVMFGDSGTSAGVEVRNDLLQLGVANRILLAGWVDDFSHIVLRADLLVATSSRESFGRTLAEALISGTPVIASDIPAHREVLQNGRFGRLYGLGDPLELSQLIRDFVNGSGKLRQETVAGQEFVERFHNPANHAARVKQLYWRLTGE